MSTKRILVFLGILTLAVVILAACGSAGEEGAAGNLGPKGDQGEQGAPGEAASADDLACTECHDDTTRLFQAQQQWAVSTHGSGTAAAYAGGRAGCTACHSSEGFTAMKAAGVGIEELEEAPLVPSKVNCRTCHEIHTTYTGDDFALTSSDVVALIAFEDTTFDGGMGNLCANCHQPRRAIAAADDDGMIEVTSTHWGPHHGPQSAMLLGIGGAGVEGKASMHASQVEDTCVSCHVNENNGYDHSMAPNVASCTSCHTDAEDLDIGGVQTEVEALLAELLELLEAADMYHDHPVVGIYEAAKAQALWNYIFIAVEDGSNGAHNAKYTIALLEASIEALK